MLVLRIFPFRVLKYQRRFILSYSRCLSHVSSSSKTDLLERNDQEQSISTTKPIDDSNNEWLWAYLRDRKTFADLSEKQRRRVVEIGSNVVLN